MWNEMLHLPNKENHLFVFKMAKLSALNELCGNVWLKLPNTEVWLNQNSIVLLTFTSIYYIGFFFNFFSFFEKKIFIFQFFEKNISRKIAHLSCKA